MTATPLAVTFLELQSHGRRSQGSPPTDRIASTLMTLSPGNRLGPYEILPPRGARRTGEVCRACDERLKRDVADKALPDSVSAGL